MKNIKYCVEVAEEYYKEGVKGVRFKQKYIGVKEDLEAFRELLTQLKGHNIKAKIVDFETCQDIEKNYNSLIWG